MASLLSLFKQVSYVLGDQYKSPSSPSIAVFAVITGKDGNSGSFTR